MGSGGIMPTIRGFPKHFQLRELAVGFWFDSRNALS
jgi:hypothetical protein